MKGGVGIYCDKRLAWQIFTAGYWGTRLGLNPEPCRGLAAYSGCIQYTLTLPGQVADGVFKANEFKNPLLYQGFWMASLHTQRSASTVCFATHNVKGLESGVTSLRAGPWELAVGVSPHGDIGGRRVPEDPLLECLFLDSPDWRVLVWSCCCMRSWPTSWASKENNRKQFQVFVISVCSSVQLLC